MSILFTSVGYPNTTHSNTRKTMFSVGLGTSYILKSSPTTEVLNLKDTWGGAYKT